MGMTMTQKILAKHAGLDHVVPGQLVEARLDLVLGNDITTPVAVSEFDKAGPIKLLFLVLAHHHLPVFRQDGQIVIAPLGILGVIAVGVGQPSQVPYAPAHPPAVPLQVAVLTGCCPNHGGQTLGNRRLLSNHKFHNLHPPILPARACAVFSQYCFPHPAAGHSRTDSHSGTASPADR